MSKNLLDSAMSGGRSSRYGDLVIVTLSGGAFATSAMEFHQIQNWARGRVGSDNGNRDRMTFMNRFETLLGRSGGGVATRGNRKQLSVIVHGMEKGGVSMEGWMVPDHLDQSMEMARKKPKVDAPTPDAATAQSPFPSG